LIVVVRIPFCFYPFKQPVDDPHEADVYDMFKNLTIADDSDVDATERDVQ
jgi:hypothetical protein